MTNNEILETLFTNDYLLNLCKNITRHNYLYQDLFQEICLIILEYDNKKLNQSYNKKWLKYFVINIITNQYKSKTSPFYKKFKKFEKEIVDQNYDITDTEYSEDNHGNKLFTAFEKIEKTKELSFDIHNKIDRIDEILKKIHWYDRTIFEIYFKLNDYNIIDGIRKDVDCKGKRSSYRRISKLTGIYYVSIGNTVNKVIKEIQDNL